ncbi:hypothetical protein NVP1161O_162 [Vibrio phage 1.161.O._10N.261.48.C5]|nr:hypothetical protein NVP1161O_162 [Vibrio phage 1.161.O._10N.261.48.C5]
MELELSNRDVVIAIEEFIEKRFPKQEMGTDGRWHTSAQVGGRVEAVRYVVSLEEQD